MKKALYRKQICAEKEKLTPEKVFHTPQYRDLLTSIGHEITGGKLTTLRLYDDKNSGIADRGSHKGQKFFVFKPGSFHCPFCHFLFCQGFLWLNQVHSGKN